jgi:hypothetical protein
MKRMQWAVDPGRRRDDTPTPRVPLTRYVWTVADMQPCIPGLDRYVEIYVRYADVEALLRERDEQIRTLVANMRADADVEMPLRVTANWVEALLTPTPEKDETR